MKVIGIVGTMGSGKDTFAEIVRDKLKPSTTLITHFADPVKAIATELGWDGNKDKKGRRLLQLLGTDVCRQCIDDNYWTNKMAKLLTQKSGVPATRYVLIPDVRFANEVELLQKYNAEIIVINRPIKGFWNKLKAFFKPKHKSEQYNKWIKKYPHIVIQNNKSYADFKAKVEKQVQDYQIGCLHNGGNPIKSKIFENG